MINISGLALGISISLLIGLWINDELQFNKHFTNYHRIGRLVRNITVNNEILSRTYLPNTIGDALRSQYKDLFLRVSMAYPIEDYFITVGEKKLTLRGEFLEPEGVALFDLKMVHGQLNNMTDSHSIFLSESVSIALFGNENPVGKQLSINNSMDATVTGVYEDMPASTMLF
ncbi:MAG: ABC transporter permease [Bacteroidia bacterium]|nr:ABC transporter permease [Bacteroidia bacterium]